MSTVLPHVCCAKVTAVYTDWSCCKLQGWTMQIARCPSKSLSAALNRHQTLRLGNQTSMNLMIPKQKTIQQVIALW